MATFPRPRQGSAADSMDGDARLKALIGSIDEIVFEFDAEGRYLNIWTTNEELLYRPRQELLGKRNFDVFGEEYRQPFRDIFRRVLETGRGENFEYALDVMAGRRWFLGRVNRIPSADGTGHTLGMLVRDITDRKNAEERFSKAFQASPDAMYICTLKEGRLLEVNDGFLRLTGYDRHEAIGRSTLELGLWPHPKEREQALLLLKRIGELRDLEMRFATRNGEARTVLCSAHTIDLNGTPCSTTILRDVTGRRALEEQLRQAQKMEAVGRLAGGVAHDFNNLLVGILGYSDLLKKKLQDSAGLQHMAEEINCAALRARDLTSRLLALSRRQVLQPRVLDFNAALRQAERLLRPVLSEDIQIELRMDLKVGAVKADPAQLEQVILNLALNARDAMPNGGTLSLETANIAVDPAFARQHPGLIPGSYVRLWVADTGHGIRPDVMPRIFEPFFTTKEHGAGSGLGLSTVYGIVKQSGGCVTVTSEPGRGTAFGIYLPRVNEPPEIPARQPEPKESQRGWETILLVEDEPIVRSLARDVLEESGYKILCTPDGAAALKTALEMEEPVHLLISDVVMPEMSGPELATRLRNVLPQTRVLYMSGYSNDEVLCRKGVPEDSAFLQKPFTPEQLVRKVRETLDAHARRAE